MLQVGVFLTCFIDEGVSSLDVLNGFLPLEVELVTFLVESAEFFSGFVELDLGRLGLGDFVFELLGLASDLNRELLDLEGQLFDLGLIRASVLFHGQVVLFFLTGGERPLLKLLLVPIHLQFELVHALVRLKDHVLNIVQAILLVGDSRLQLFNLVLQAATLPFGDLLHVFFSFDFFVLSVN